MSKQGKGRGKGRGRSTPSAPPLVAVNPPAPVAAATNLQQNYFSPAPVSENRGRGRSSRRPNAQQQQDSCLSNFDTSCSLNSPGRGRSNQRSNAEQLHSPDDSYQSNPNTSGSSNSSVTPPPSPPLSDTPPPSPPSENHRTLIKRPGFGTAGRKIDLEVNYFRMKASGTVYHYDVEINSFDMMKKYGVGKMPKRQTAAEAAVAGVSRIDQQLDRNVGRMKCREVFESLVNSHALKQFNPVYDGCKNIFTSSPLPFKNKQEFTVEVEVFGKTRKYEVIIQPVRKEAHGTNAINLSSMHNNTVGLEEVLMAFNSIMNHRDPPSNQIQVGRSFFFLSQPNKVYLGEGLEIWFGYNQSVHMTLNGPALVLNLAAKAFHQAGSVIDYICEILRRDIRRDRKPLEPYDIKKCEDALKGVKVVTTHMRYKRKYTIQGVSKVTAQDLKLNCDGKQMTVAEYFQNRYGRLKYPFLHCLHMRSNNQTYIPIEHCEILEGQPKQGKLSGPLTAKMIRQTAIAPSERFKSIMSGAQDVENQSGEKMRSYNLFMDVKPKSVQGRVLNPPSLAYGDKNSTNPDQRGVWRMDGKNFFRASIDIQSWLILSFVDERGCSRNALKAFSETFARTGAKVGLNFGHLLDIRTFRRNDSSEYALRDAAKSGASFCIIVLSRRDPSRSYDEIKFIADYKLGLVTQCIEESVLARFNDQIANNLCLKINTKLGGVNHVLFKKPRIFAKPVIVLGADVVHAPRGSGCPSIASVVGSLDAYPSKYKVACRVQENPDMSKISQELILDIRDMVKAILKAFYHHTRGKYPEKVIFFRDGVSEGQFEKVRDFEVSEVQEACRDVIGSIVPITFVVVQKRHQTRFRPRNPRDGVGKGGNVPPGTTVDTEITHPDHFDYFLNSHEGIQGTSKPAHYTVLHDDNNFGSDEIQELSYHLCYTYVKCNRSISIPAPVMYADLACYRAKKYADFHLQKERESCSSSSSSSVRLPDHAKRAIESMGDYRASMFFV